MAAPFWTRFDNYNDSIALIESQTDRKITYQTLSALTARISAKFQAADKGLIFLPLTNSIDDIVLYLAALRSGHAVFPYGSHHTAHQLQGLVDEFSPTWVIGRAASLAPRKYRPSALAYMSHDMAELVGNRQFSINASLQLLLSTSGSTGTSKLVRLSAKNIDENATQICRSLHIDYADVGVTALPVIYVYGMSVLHSHLSTGAAVVVEARSVMNRGFLTAIDSNGVTSLSGIPWTFELLQSIRFENFLPQTLRRLTTSGDHLKAGLIHWLNEKVRPQGVNIYSMYGQTEASGRMCVLSPEQFCRKPLSVGTPVPGAAVHIKHDGAITFHGPNVMLGYAKSGEDLALGDINLGSLDTGDFGYQDEEGCLFLSARKKGKVKIYGVQVDLNEVRDILSEVSIVEVKSASASNVVKILHTREQQDFSKEIDLLSKTLNIPRHAIVFERMTNGHRTFSGKLKTN